MRMNDIPFLKVILKEKISRQKKKIEQTEKFSFLPFLRG